MEGVGAGVGLLGLCGMEAEQGDVRIEEVGAEVEEIAAKGLFESFLRQLVSVSLVVLLGGQVVSYASLQ